MVCLRNTFLFHCARGGLTRSLPRRFGPIGVSALYYAILARENIPEDRTALHTVIFPVVIFMAMSSTFIHVSRPHSEGLFLAER